MRESRAVAIVMIVGVVTFLAVYALLQISGLDAAAGGENPASEVNTPPDARAGRAADSLASSLPPATTLIGVPQAGSQPLLRDVQAGDRLDVLVSLTGVRGSSPLTAIAVRGATVVRPPSGDDPVLVEVPSTDAIVLAHLLLSGQRLSYVVWPVDATGPPPVPAVDARTVRQVLGLEPTDVASTAAPVPSATPAAAGAPPTPAATPSLMLGAASSGFIYQVQPGDTWASLASTFGWTPQELRRWNDAPDESPLVPGSLLIVPRRTG